MTNAYSSLMPNVAKVLESMPSLPGISSGMKPPSEEEPKKKVPSDSDSVRFGNFTNEGTGAIDLDKASKYLTDKGLTGMGAIQPPAPIVNKYGVVNSQPIVKSQSASGASLVSGLLQNAFKMGLRKPEEIEANKEVLINKLPPELKELVNNWGFKSNHPNFWEVMKRNILPEQWKKFDDGTLPPALAAVKPIDKDKIEQIQKFYNKITK